MWLNSPVPSRTDGCSRRSVQIPSQEAGITLRLLGGLLRPQCQVPERGVITASDQGSHLAGASRILRNAREITLDPSVGCWKGSSLPKLVDSSSCYTRGPVRGAPEVGGFLSAHPRVRGEPHRAKLPCARGRKGVTRAQGFFVVHLI